MEDLSDDKHICKQNMIQMRRRGDDGFSDALPLFLSLGSSYSKRGGQADNRTAVEDSGRKGSSGSSTTKVPASPLVSSDRKKSATPSTVRPNAHTAYTTFSTLKRFLSET